jgi:hypothetical protein
LIQLGMAGGASLARARALAKFGNRLQVHRGDRRQNLRFGNVQASADDSIRADFDWLIYGEGLHHIKLGRYQRPRPNGSARWPRLESP